MIFEAQGTNNKWDVFHELLNWHLDNAITVKIVNLNKNMFRHILLDEKTKAYV